MSDRPWYSVKDLHSVANYVGACKSQWKMVYDQSITPKFNQCGDKQCKGYSDMFQSAIMIYLWGSSSISSANGEKLFLLIVTPELKPFKPFLEKSHVPIPLPALLLVKRKCPVKASLIWGRETFSSLLNTNVELVLRK